MRRDPAGGAMATTERMVSLEGDRRLFVSESTGRGGLPVLFLSSLAADHTSWDGVRQRLRRRSVAYDTRGHGRSDVVADDADIAGLAADALAVMDAAGLDRAVLCGLSLGGLTAMEIAARAPERVAGLVLANAAVNFPPASMWVDRAATARSGGFSALVEPTLERWLTADFRAANDEETSKVRVMIAATPAAGYAAACAALASGDGTEALRGYAGPVLVIAGEHDRSTPVVRAEEMRDIAQNSELLVLDAAHLSAVERADEFAAALEAFVAKVEDNG